MKQPRQYDERHAYADALERGGRLLVRWLGDPARGEFMPREKKRNKRRRRRS